MKVHSIGLTELHNAEIKQVNYVENLSTIFLCSFKELFLCLVCV